MIKHSFSLYTLNQDLTTQPIFNLENYSKFKYGDGSIAKQYALELANYLQSTLIKSKRYSLSGSAYHHTPTAATSVAKHLFMYLQSFGFDIIYSPLRCRTHAQDYSSMNYSQRTKVVNNNKLSIKMSPTQRKENRSLIVIDDVRITGLHEKVIESFLLDQGFKEVIFGYVVKLNTTDTKKSPQVEFAINHTYVDNLNKLAQIMNKVDFTPNARICKFILSAPVADLEEFLVLVPVQKLHKITKLIEQDNYHLLDIYNSNYQVISKYIFNDTQPAPTKALLTVP